ncbi:MAG: hypothetical protein CMH69_17045 [Nitratireductor sp.]|nr:hypothetical protein [Nitratireductor sp.]
MRYFMIFPFISLFLTGCVSPEPYTVEPRGPGALTGSATPPPYVKGGFPGKGRLCETRNGAGEPVTYNC